MIEGIIYCYHSPSNKYYIGQTIHESKRKRQHIQLSNTGDNAYFHKAIRKHGFKNFKYSVLFHFSSLNKDRVKEVQGGNKFIDPSGGPMIVVGYELEEAKTVVKSIDFVKGYGYTITFE